jgi:low temperature requirement protein LtrA
LNPYILSSFFLIGSVIFFIMAYILKRNNKNTTFFSFITGILLLIFSIMGFLKFKNYIVITILIVGYYLGNALFDMKHRKTKVETYSRLQFDKKNRVKKSSK